MCNHVNGSRSYILLKVDHTDQEVIHFVFFVSEAEMELSFTLSWFMLGILFNRLISANPDAKRLYDDLLSNYNRLIRPVGNNSDRLTVKLGLKLSQLIDVVS